MKGTITNLPFENNSIDLILCSDILEHVEDKEAVKEIKRVLKPKGILIFSVPAHNYLWGPTDMIGLHRKRYEKKDLRKLFRKSFKELKLNYWNFFLFFPNLIFTFLSRFLNKNKSENSLNLIPNYLNNFFYFLIFLENKLFLKFKIPQGVSIIGVENKIL